MKSLDLKVGIAEIGIGYERRAIDFAAALRRFVEAGRNGSIEVGAGLAETIGGAPGVGEFNGDIISITIAGSVHIFKLEECDRLVTTMMKVREHGCNDCPACSIVDVVVEGIREMMKEFPDNNTKH